MSKCHVSVTTDSNYNVFSSLHFCIHIRNKLFPRLNFTFYTKYFEVFFNMYSHMLCFMFLEPFSYIEKSYLKKDITLNPPSSQLTQLAKHDHDDKLGVFIGYVTSVTCMKFVNTFNFLSWLLEFCL